MKKKLSRRSLPSLAMILLFNPSLWAPGALRAMIPRAVPQPAPQMEGWTSPVAAMRKTLKVASYRARLAGDVLVIEVTHEPGWHTSALDNPERAQKRTTEPPLGIEKPTRIEVGGGLKVAGKWRQSQPKDLSQREINWFTWGFEGTTLFAVRVERNGAAPEALITINGQACQATTCALIDDLEIRLTLASGDLGPASFDLASLIEEGDLTDVR